MLVAEETPRNRRYASFCICALVLRFGPDDVIAVHGKRLGWAAGFSMNGRRVWDFLQGWWLE
jgi:hypothetical protein